MAARLKAGWIESLPEPEGEAAGEEERRPRTPSLRRR